MLMTSVFAASLALPLAVASGAALAQLLPSPLPNTPGCQLLDREPGSSGPDRSPPEIATDLNKHVAGSDRATASFTPARHGPVELPWIQDPEPGRFHGRMDAQTRARP
jgi:hypothetical protein